MFDVEGFILVGGASRRMGRNKAELQLGSQTVLERIAAELAAATSSVSLVGARHDYPGVSMRNIRDVHPEWGALGGIHAALSSTKAEWALIVACDLPFVTRDLFERLKNFVTERFDAIVPIQPDGLPQPICALYRPAKCLPAIDTLIMLNEHMPRMLLREVTTEYVLFREISDLPGAEDFFLNLNTPEDFDRAKKLTQL